MRWAQYQISSPEAWNAGVSPQRGSVQNFAVASNSTVSGLQVILQKNRGGTSIQIGCPKPLGFGRRVPFVVQLDRTSQNIAGGSESAYPLCLRTILTPKSQRQTDHQTFDLLSPHDFPDLLDVHRQVAASQSG